MAQSYVGVSEPCLVDAFDVELRRVNRRRF